MLYPQSNSYRQTTELSGFWNFRFDTQDAGLESGWHLVCLNRYLGWYTQGGSLDEALPLLSDELDSIFQKFGKPILLSEFGADAIPGHHAQPPEMFSEEYQAELLVRYIELLRKKPYVVGEHIWNMCDFKTSQGITRVGALNYKGIFTRDRRPKLAAHHIRALWHKTQSGKSWYP